MLLLSRSLLFRLQTSSTATLPLWTRNPRGKSSSWTHKASCSWCRSESDLLSVTSPTDFSSWWSQLVYFVCHTRKTVLFPTGIAVASEGTWRRWWWTCSGSIWKLRSSFRTVRIAAAFFSLCRHVEGGSSSTVHCQKELPGNRILNPLFTACCKKCLLVLGALLYWHWYSCKLLVVEHTHHLLTGHIGLVNVRYAFFLNAHA